MLQDYIREYFAAKQKNDTKIMRRIERELARLGMDKATLNVLCGAIKKGEEK